MHVNNMDGSWLTKRLHLTSAPGLESEREKEREGWDDDGFRILGVNAGQKPRQRERV